MTDSWKKAFEAACHEVCDQTRPAGCGKCPFGDDPATAITKGCQMIASNTLTAALNTMKARGYVVVPEKPTKAMLESSENLPMQMVYYDSKQAERQARGRHIYTAMITAAQKEMEG